MDDLSQFCLEQAATAYVAVEENRRYEQEEAGGMSELERRHLELVAKARGEV